MGSSDLDILLQAKLDVESSYKAISGQVSNLAKRLADSKLEIQVDTKQIDELSKKITTLTNNLSNSTIKVNMDTASIDAINKKFEETNTSVDRLGKNDSLKGLGQNLDMNRRKVEEFGKSIRDMNEISIKKTFLGKEMNIDQQVQEVRTFKNELGQIVKMTENIKTGDIISESTVDRAKASKEAYAMIEKHTKEIAQIESLITETKGKQQQTLINERSARQDNVKALREVINSQGLVNQASERQLKLQQEIRDIQSRIKAEGSVEQQSAQAYRERVSLLKEEYAVRGKINAEQIKGRTTVELEKSLADIRARKNALEDTIRANDGLLESEKRLAGFRATERKLETQYRADMEKLQQQQAERLAKFGNEVGGVGTVKQADIVNNNTNAIKEQVKHLVDANAQIVNYTSRGADGTAKFTARIKESNDVMSEQVYTIDKVTGAVYKQEAVLKPLPNKFMSIAQQMGEAMKKSLQWAVAMGVLYGSMQKFKDGVEIVRQMDKELTQVAMVTGQTREQVQGLAQEYSNLANQMGKTVMEIAQVNTQLIRQGLSIQESQQRLETVLKLSAVANISAEESLKVITSSVNALGAGAEETADVLVKVGNISATSAGEVGEALTKVASSAQATGMELTELGGILGTLVEVTQESPSSLGNSLKTLLARFSQVNEETGELNEDLNKVQTAFESVGIAFTDAEGQIRPMYELLEDLSGIWDTLDKNTKAYISTTSAGKQYLMPEAIAICA